MKKFTGIFILFLAGLIMISCENEEWNQTDKDSQNGFTLKYTVSDPISAITRTTIEAQEGENKVNSLYILFFENSDNGNGLFLEAIDVRNFSGTTIGATGKLQIDFPENSILNNSTDYKILFCANIEEYTTLSVENIEDIQNHFQGHSENEVIASLSLNISGVSPGLTEELDNSNLVKPSNLPMSATAIKKAKNANVSVELVRALSRFDVFCQAAGYELVSASIWNANTAGTLCGKLSHNNNHTERYYGVGVNQDKQIVGSLYAFENYVAEPTQNDNRTTCLIIGLRSDETGQIEYFRVNVNPDFMEQDLKRNNVYRSTVREVLGQGAITEREAYEGANSLLDIDINGWMLEDNGNFYHDGTNILALPTKLIELFPYGDERIYNVYTLGEGNPTISHTQLPDNITAKLIANQLIVTAEASDEPGEGFIQITFGKLTGSIIIRQKPLERDFIDLSVNELPAFSEEAGEISAPIQVSSSGTWVAEIYDGDYFGFSSQNEPARTIKGESGDFFNLETTKANTDNSSRYCFAIVKLQEIPEVSRVLLLEQSGVVVIEEYIRFNPGKDITAKPAGETISNIKLESNAEWEAFLYSLSGRPATFTENNQKVSTIKGYGDKSFTVNLPANNTSKADNFYLIVSTTGGKNAILTFKQAVNTGTNPEPEPEPEPKPKESMLFIANGTGAGNLVSNTSLGYQQFVYVLGSTFRDTSKFGKKGNFVKLEKDGFDYKSSLTSSNIADAKVIQLLSNPTEADFDKIYKNMQADPNTFLMITSTSATEVTNILKQFKAKTNAGYGSAVSISNPAVNYRPMNSGLNKNHPLVKYLMNGPGGTITELSSVSLQSNQPTGAGLKSSAYPSTFVPIIMSNQNNTYCVFGIDPVHRLIIMTDPGIFGCYPTYNYPSAGNYSYNTSKNWVFLNNVASWIVSATGINGFLKGYQ